MAEDKYDNNMAAAIDALIKEATSWEEVNAERILSLQVLSQESREIRPAVEDKTASQDSASKSSRSESSTLDLSAFESLESLSEESEMDASIGELDTGGAEKSAIGQAADQSTDSHQDDAKTDEAHKKSLEILVRRLRDCRIKLEDASYDINYDVPLTVWTRKERIIMRNEIRLMSYEIRKKWIIEKMMELNNSRASKGSEEAKLAMELVELLLKDIFLLRVMPFRFVVFPRTVDIYDWDKISESVKRRHSPAECHEFWYTKFHPLINGECWSKAENRELVALADESNLSYWDEIAQRLGTQRTGFQCYVQYRRYLCKK